MRIQAYFLSALFIVLIASCGKRREKIIENPEPTEPELITTVRVKATRLGNNNDIQYFDYKVDNGFQTTQTDFQVDTIRLKSGNIYNIEIFVLDESNPIAIDVTAEIIEEKNSHLFYYESTPEEGPGSIKVFDKDKDNNGQDFARVCKWQTSSAGNGALKIILIHGPRNKAGTTRDGIAGATDADVIYPVVLN